MLSESLLVTFEVGNVWTWIHDAPAWLTKVFSSETSYPTQTAELLAMGFQAPDSADGRGWDGWVRLMRWPSFGVPSVPTGLLYILERVCRKFGVQWRVNDRRVRPVDNVPELGVNIPLRDYQEIAVQAALRAGRGVWDMPPRSGKTRAGVALVSRLALRTLWVVPTDRIAKQTLKTFDVAFGPGYARHQVGADGSEALRDARVVVCTAATSVLLDPGFYLSREVLIVDEWHHAAAKTYHDLSVACEHVYYRFGMTGTNYRSGQDLLSLHAVLSQTICKISSAELVRRGVLVPTDVLFLPVRGRVVDAGGNFQVGLGRAGLYENEERNGLVVEAADLLAKQGRTVLVLVGTKAQGKLIVQQLLPRFAPRPSPGAFGQVEYVDSDGTKPRVDAVLDAFATGVGPRVLVGTSLVGEGVDVPVADAMVLACGGKARVTLTQSGLRVATAVPGKARSVLVDFADKGHRKLLEHSMERVAVFCAEPVFQVHMAPRGLQDLHAWSAAYPVGSAIP